MTDEQTGSTALVLREEAQSEFMPILSPQMALKRYRAVQEIVSDILKKDLDFGLIPGVAKPSLFKPGAEKLCSFFGYTSVFTCVERAEDWSGDDHGGEAFFYYEFLCELWRGNTKITGCVGSCNSWESKYRYRKSERVCPQCGKAAIIKGQAKYGGGWLCFVKKDGCGAKFQDGDRTIEEQIVGRVPNPDIADLVNTVQKMAQKRAFVGATLIAANASDFFTQDVEDMPHISDAVPVEAEAAAMPRNSAPKPQPAAQKQQAMPPPAPKPDTAKIAALIGTFGNVVNDYLVDKKLLKAGQSWRDASDKVLNRILEKGTEKGRAPGDEFMDTVEEWHVKMIDALDAANGKGQIPQEQELIL